MLNELIDHINVYETQGTGKNKTQRLVIYYKFVGYLDIDPTQCHPNYTADIREGVAIEYISCEPPENLKELFPEGCSQTIPLSIHLGKKADVTEISYIRSIWQQLIKMIRFHLASNGFTQK